MPDRSIPHFHRRSYACDCIIVVVISSMVVVIVIVVVVVVVVVLVVSGRAGAGPGHSSGAARVPAFPCTESTGYVWW